MDDSFYQTNDQISASYSFISSAFDGQKQCIFCQRVNLQRCMSSSLLNKHNQVPNFYLNITTKLVEKSLTPVFNKFQEISKHIDRQERMTRCYDRSSGRVQSYQLLEYYKYRKFVPLFADGRLGKMLHSYYYERLKLYYNQIKQKLNLTVDPSSDSDFSHSDSSFNSRNLPQSKILDQLSVHFKIEEPTGPTLQNSNTESKALENLLQFLQSNEKFNNVKPFKAQNDLSSIKRTSKEIFRDIILQEKNKKKDLTKSNKKIFITFYSRSGSIPKEKNNKNNLKVLKSQNLTKNKRLKSDLKQNEFKILHKLDKIKDGILQQKVKQMITNRNESKEKKIPIIQAYQAGKKVSIKQNQHLKIQNGFKKRKSVQKTILENGSEKMKIPLKEDIRRQYIKVKKSQSESKMKSTPVSFQKNKGLKSISNRNLHNFVNGQRISLQKQLTPLKQSITKIIDRKRSVSSRKSLDFTKMRPLFPQSQSQKVNYVGKKQEYLTQKYQNLLLQTPKRFIKTTNVSPINSKRQKDSINHVILEKNDNIVSMKKKKLQLLKKKMEFQKIEKK